MTDSSRTLYLTMDTDWASDDVLADTLTLINGLNLPVTIFVTHATRLLPEMRKNPLIRLGIHPNFYPQLNNTAGQDFLSEIREIKTIVPEAVCARSHGLIDSTSILLGFKDFGITHDLNLFIPFSADYTLKPFRHFSGITRIPYFYEDDAWCLEPVKRSAADHVLSESAGLKVFNFHPIHLFLNTEDMARYRKAKSCQNDIEDLRRFVNHDVSCGARIFLGQLVETARQNGYSFSFVEQL